MPAALNPRPVRNRRNLHFLSLDDIARDLNAIAAWKEGAAPAGNWSPGQNLAHLALTMTRSIDGFPTRMSWPARTFLRLFIKRHILRNPMKPGFKAPKNAGIMPPPMSLDEGLAMMRHALHRLNTESRRSPSPILGPLTSGEWDQLHCRHAELHLSFIIPAETPP